MPKSVITSFVDPDEYKMGVRATDLEFSITQRGTFTATVTRIDLHTLWMQRFYDSLPRVCHHTNMPGRAIFSFVPRSHPSVLVDGMEQSAATILHFKEAGRGFQVSTGPTLLATMSLPIAEIEALGATYAEADLTPPRDTLMTNPAPAAMERLQSLYADAAGLAEHAPEIIAHPESARALEQALIGALADCIGCPGEPGPYRRGHSYAKLMRRLHALLESNPGRVLHVPDVCRLLGTSNRTLTTCCHVALGMSPHRYFRVRQMNLVRGALRLADPATTNVTEIATGHGFWELGRFAAAYRALFGELPSTTLRRRSSEGPNLFDESNIPLFAEGEPVAVRSRPVRGSAFRSDRVPGRPSNGPRPDAARR